MSDKTKLFNKYIVIVTSLSPDIGFEEVLELYRYRRQVELYFERLKSIPDYGELLKKKEESVFAWLNGKLMITLLIEKIISKVSFFLNQIQNNMRSIWKETKFIKLLIISNALNVCECLANAINYLHIEKRKRRYLQTTKY